MSTVRIHDKGNDAPSAARLLGLAVVTLAPPLIAFCVEWFVFATLGSRWLLMLCAVIVSAAIGGMPTGLVTTVVGAALVWWFFIPHVGPLGTTDPRHYLSVALFLAIGYAISLLHERLRLTKRGLAHTARQNHIFAALIENSSDFIGIVDPDGTPVYLNPAGRRMVEMPQDMAIEHTRIADYFPPDLREFVHGTLDTMRAKDRWAGELRLRNWRTNAPIPVLDTHFLIREPATREVIGMATITRDISEQIAQRDALQESNQKLATTMRELAESQRFLQGVLDYSPNAIVIKDRDGRYLLVNKAFRAITHLGNNEAAGKRDAELFGAPLAQHLHANDQNALATRQAIVTEETVELDSDQRTYLLTKFPLSDEAGAIFALGGIWTDITKLKELQRLRDEWTSVIAHDLRQPIATVVMASELLAELQPGKANEDEHTLVERIQMAAQSLRRMVDDLMDMSLLEAKRLTLVRQWAKPCDLVRRTVEHLSHLPGIDRVQVRDETDVPQISIDPMRIEQVLTNLISNAIKYGDDASEIIVRVEMRDNEVRVAVTNHGRGIPADEMPELFNRFARSKSARASGVRGLGLGLYITRGVIEAHGGRLWAESTPGETTTFHVALPIAAETRQAA